MVKLENNWDNLLKDEFQKDYYLKLRETLKDEYKNYTIYPKMDNIYDALKKVDYEDVEVVILGQDPYHGPNQAHGHSFSVLPGVRKPPSVQNIFQELKNDIGCYIPNNGYLMKWVEQGVLLLNTSLTVRAGNANSHKDLGWQILTDKIIEILGNREKPMVFILWGRNAINKERLINNKNHLILKSVHPSPLSAYRGFFGSKPFSKCNEFLKKNDMKPIDWQIENI
ncbi:uracil-DNA glycosylase [Miniphocibacter massiliensis]|uniref:uracil-DNA glycosylase n=1 Tax=Miniphocaeibacter massiliensis TaxID=2041841 RepID=UPI000C06B110